MNKKLILILAVLLILGTIPKAARFFGTRNTAPQKFTVYYEKPQFDGKISDIELSGELKPYFAAQIYSKIDGLLKERYVNLGDKVKKGQLLAVVDAPVIDSDKITAEANLNAAKKALIEAEYNLNYAKTTFERYKNASVDGAVSVQDLRTKENDFNAAQMEYKIALQNVESAKSQLKKANELKNYERITAPFDGVITNYNIDAGSNIVAGGSATSTVLFEIAQTNKLRLRADIPQSCLDRIKENKEIKFYLPENPNKIYQGKIERIQKSVDAITRTMKIEIITDNSGGQLYPGLYVKLVIPQNPDRKNLFIKNELVITDKDGTKVLTVNDSGRLHFLPVTIGTDYGEVVEITKGLNGDEKIVSNYNDNLREGQEVTLYKP